MAATLTRVMGVLVFGVAAVLLTSIGGLGIAASPITLPLMLLLVFVHPTQPFRIAGVIIGGLTAFEGGWGLGFLLFGRDSAATIVTAFGVAVVFIVLFGQIGSGHPRETGATTSLT